MRDRAELQRLYEPLVVDHGNRPRHFGRPARHTHHAEGYNPLCGDRFTVYVQVEDGVIRDVGFEGSGCTISKASASLMTGAVVGKTVPEAERLFHDFHDMVVNPATPTDAAKLGKLVAFAGVRENALRAKCATLPWHTLHEALATDGQRVTTE
jgi:nitrogen fixation protein NifU and related proteins